jgi:hypothetical protein
MGYVYSDNSFGGDPHHGHNSMACQLLDGTFCYIVSEVVPFTIFTATTLNGPWTPCPSSPGNLSLPSAFGGDTNFGSNVSIVVRPDGNFELIQRHGVIALSTTGVCGPYAVQTPTNIYPASEAVPAQYAASIYPNRQSHSDPLAGQPGGPPGTGVQSTYVSAEDPVIWYSGGQYHVLYDYPGDRVGYHLTSPDGIHDWTDRGLAYDPRLASKIFSYTDGTVSGWFKMERPNVVLENDHVTYVTWAVSDVDKDCQIGAGSDHGSKVIVVPFDGCAFDHETGDGGVCDAGGGGSSSSTSSGATGSSTSTGATSSSTRSSATSTGVTSSSTGSAATSSVFSGGSIGTVSSVVHTIGANSGGTSSGSVGSSSGGGGAGGNGTGAANPSSGCGCRIEAGSLGEPPASRLLAPLGAWLLLQARRRRPRSVAGSERHPAMG